MGSFPPGSVAFVQGGTRGIGLEFVRQLASCGRFARIYASGRSAADAPELLALVRQWGERVVPVPLNLAWERDIENAAATVRRRDPAVHLLINASGLLHDAANELWPEKRLEDIDAESLLRSFQVNAFGPVLMAKHFRDLLCHGRRGVLASLSARVGSIGDNRLGGWYAYRAAKAAQNMFTRTLAVEFSRRAPRLVCLALHPGTTDTGLSQPFQARVPAEKLFSVEFAAERLLGIIDGADEQHHGGFFAWDGQRIPW
jgi:NAD(P)-dependent dehydrogenase (short-subunit alcohol dehydrogenase family)